MSARHRIVDALRVEVGGKRSRTKRPTKRDQGPRTRCRVCLTRTDPTKMCSTCPRCRGCCPRCIHCNRCPAVCPGHDRESL